CCEWPCHHGCIPCCY
uniref:Conotoxin In1746 n=1 Tax=Conus inscriptus TaxID=257329 RepID=CM746_CONIN|nr:RecName: Full=Conotoxin In1746; AltName: Full=Conotoxin In1762 [Conus inscriptus]